MTQYSVLIKDVNTFGPGWLPKTSTARITFSYPSG